MLVLTRPDVIAEHPRRVPGRRRRHHRDQHVQLDVGVAGRLRSRGDRVRAEFRGREAGAACRRRVRRRRHPTKPRFVAGSLGPTTKTLSISPDVNNPAFRAITFDEMRDAFKDQARGLIDGGSDLLLVETQIDTLNAKAALVAIDEVFEEKGVRLPLMVSATLTDRSGRTLSGQTLDAFYLSIEHSQAVQRRPQLRAWRARNAAVPRRPRARGRRLRQLLSERRAAERVRRVRRAARRRPPALSRNSPRAASSTSSAAAAERRPITSGRSLGQWKTSRPRAVGKVNSEPGVREPVGND